MEKTLDVIEDLQKKGLINQYAIGGGIAAISMGRTPTKKPWPMEVV